MQDIEKQQNLYQLLSCPLQSFAQSSVVKKKVIGVAQNCEIMSRAKGQGGETACMPYYGMAYIELHDGKK